MTPKKVTNAAGQVRWEIRVSHGTGAARKFMRRRYLTEKEAKIELARIKHEQNEGVFVHRDKNMTIAKLAEIWAEANAPKQSKNTARFYDDILKPLIERHGDMPVMDLTDQHLIKLRDDKHSGKLRRVGTAGEPMSARSVNAMLGAIWGLLSYAQHKRLVVHNVCNTKSVPRVVDRDVEDLEEDTRRSAWADGELRKFRVAVTDDWLEASWLLSAQGLRRGEVLGLKWSDINWETGSVKIVRTRTYVAGEDVVGPPKSKASKRTLNMGAEVIEALQRQRARQDSSLNTEGWVAVDEAGQRIRHEWYSDEFARLAKAASLPPVVLHGVRHAVATAMSAAGIPLADIARWLGQSSESLAVTLGYIHGSDASGDAIRELLSR